MVSKKYLEKLREEVASKLRLFTIEDIDPWAIAIRGVEWIKKKLDSKKIVVSSSSSKEDIAYYSSLNSSYFKKLREELIAKLTEKELDKLEEYLDEYIEISSDFANSNFYYIESTLAILENLLDIKFNIEFRN